MNITVYLGSSPGNDPKLNTAVAYCGIEIIHGIILFFNHQLLKKLGIFFLGKIDSVTLKFLVKHLPAFNNILITLFMFVP